MNTDRDTRQGSIEEHTPNDSEVTETSSAPLEASEETRAVAQEEATPDAGPVGFDTVPGGGTNRLSGGRSAARAYVRAKTPPPLHTGPHDTVSVDVDARASVESRAFQTAPSLQRRRISQTEIGSLPPVAYPTPFSWRRAALVIAGVAALSFVLVVVFARERRAASKDDLAAAAPAQLPATPLIQPPVAQPVAPLLVANPSTVRLPPMATAPAVVPASPASPASTQKSTAPVVKPRNPEPAGPSRPPPTRPQPPTETDPWLQ